LSFRDSKLGNNLFFSPNLRFTKSSIDPVKIFLATKESISDSFSGRANLSIAFSVVQIVGMYAEPGQDICLVTW